MVAHQFAPGRAVAAAIVMILLLPVLPLPGAQAQTQAPTDIFVRQGEAQFFQDNFHSGAKPTSFIDDGRAVARLQVPVYQTGTNALSNVPVYWFFYGGDVTRSGCVTVSVSGATGADAPGVGFANATIDTRDLAMGAYKVSVWAMKQPPAAAPDCSGTHLRPCGPTALTNCVNEVETGGATGVNNNALTAYFVKNAYLDLQISEIRWCPGQGGPTDTGTFNACDEDMVLDNGEVWNVTMQNEVPRLTFFEVIVRNTGSWTDLTDFGGPCNCSTDGFRYELNVSVTGPHINKTFLSKREHLLNLSEGSDGHRARSFDWDIRNTTGTYNVTVSLDPAGILRRPSTDTSVDIGQRNVRVLYRDYTAHVDPAGLRTSPSAPYAYDGPFTIEGNVTFRNIGPAAARPSPTKVNYTIYIDNLTGGFVKRGEYTPVEGGSSAIVPFSFSATSTLSSQNYIPSGKHTIYAMLDSDNETLEINETNNTGKIDIFIADDSAPKFPTPPKLVRQTQNIDDPAATELFPGQAFNLHINVSDDDAGLTVIVNATLDSNTSVYRTLPARKTILPDRYILQASNFTFYDFDNLTGRTENWTLRVRANDSFGNNATSDPVPLRLIPYPIHNASAAYVVVKPTYPNATMPWDGPDHPTWTIRLPANMTGFYGGPQQPPNQQRYTDNLALNVTTAKGVTFNINGSGWTADTPQNCLSANETAVSPNPPVQNVENTIRPNTCDAAAAELRDTFRIIVSKTQDGAGPGLWNYSIRVKDVANYTRVINGTILIEDLPPSIHLVNLSTDRVTPGQSFRVFANFTDDDHEITAAHVNFTRTSPADGKWVNLTLTNVTPRVCLEADTCYEYNDTIETGRGKLFGLGGTFNVTVSARDLTGNWNSTSAGNFTLVDEDTPTLVNYSLSTGSAAQIGENVTFLAQAADSTNVSVRLEVFRAAGSSELLFDPIMLNQTSPGNFSTTLNFSAEAVHAWRMTPIDSVNRVGAFGEGVLTVRDNLGPRFDIRSPSFAMEGKRYGSGTPTIEVVVFDVEGVSPTSIDMKVAGLAVDYDVGPAPGNLNGYLITYVVPANKKFGHNDVVTVNLSAEDNSTERLTGHLNFSFTVDDVAPVARLVRVTPSYRDQPGHILNVSLASQFELAASDNDGLPTGVESIRYRILGGGPSAAETVYTSPFKINDAPGVYTGPRKYTIQFWAEDAVGNFNRVFNITEVLVDDTPPALFQFFPQGRNINATFVDDHVGVNRSVVWYRVNNDPFVPLPLVQADGAWTITLPEGVKGDKASYYLQAWDKLDNTATFGNATNPYASFDVSNHEPNLRITSPVDGGRVFRTIDLTWDASDEDGDALVFTVYYKAPGRANYVELAKIENSATRRYSIDTTRFPDGEYTFRVAAGDGGFVKLAETKVTIINRASPVGVVSVLGDGLPGQTMLIKAEITKSEPVVEARLFLDGEFVPPGYPMNDEGRDGDEIAGDGFYSVRVPIQSAGDYSVEIFTQYREDGEMKESSVSSAATFSAKLTPGYLFSEYAAIIALIGLLAVVGIGVGAFVVMRRR